MDGKILQGDTLFEVLEIVSSLFKENKVKHCVYIQRTFGIEWSILHIKRNSMYNYTQEIAF
jgi:hypothetical protein